MHVTSFRLPILWSIPIFALWLAVPLSGAATFTAKPTADAFVTTGPSGNLSGNNYGGAGALGVAAAGEPQGEFQSLVQFSLSGARSFFDTQYGAGVWSIESITLGLTAVAGNAFFNPSRAGQFQVSWMANTGWGEGTGKPTFPTT